MLQQGRGRAVSLAGAIILAGFQRGIRWCVGTMANCSVSERQWRLFFDDGWMPCDKAEPGCSFVLAFK